MKKYFHACQFLIMLLVVLSSGVLAQVTRQPYLQIVTPVSIVVRWDTSTPEAGTVSYGLSLTALTENLSEAAATIKHQVSVSGLSPNTKYYYSIGGPSAGDSGHYFITAPESGSEANTRIWVISDWGQTDDGDNARRTQSVNVWKTFNNNDYHASFIISCGDQTESDTEPELSSTFFGGLVDVLKNTPLYTISGNHDDHDGRVVYKSVFSIPDQAEAGGYPSGSKDYYSFNFGNIHVVALSCEGVAIDGAQKAWLQNDLANNHSDWLIAFHHRPMHSAGYHPSDGSSTSLSEKVNWLTLLEDAGVDLVLSGHNHVYERSYLVDNLTGNSTDITAANRLDTLLGRLDGDGAYKKPLGCVPHKGTIFITCEAGGVSNSSSHYPVPYGFIPVHFAGSDFEGSLVIDVSGPNQMDVKFLCTDDNPFMPKDHIWDHFTLIKEGVTVVGGSSRQLPDGISVSNFPNPFNPSTTIIYHLPQNGYVSIRLYDLLGRQISVLYDGWQEQGNHVIQWTAQDDQGRELPGGIYLAQIQSGGSLRSTKMMLIR
ncbi:MAG: metallophosphoesterase [Bacteroidota bacterium]